MSLASPSCSNRATKCFLGLPLRFFMNNSNSFSPSLAPSLSSIQFVNEGLEEIVVLMFGVTLLVALAMRHLAVMFSFGESKRDECGVVAIAIVAMVTTSSSSSLSSSSTYSSWATNTFGGDFLLKLFLLG